MRVLDVAVLGLEPKGDAADWLAAHPRATASDVLALACEPELDQGQGSGAQGECESVSAPAQPEGKAPVADDGPNTCRYGGGKFTLSEGGVSSPAPTRTARKRFPSGFVPPLA